MTKSKPGISIAFLPQGINVYVSHKDQSILEEALKAGVKISSSCGGYGTCGTCLVEVKEGLNNLPERNEIELEMATDRGFKSEERLCCQLELPSTDLIVLIPRLSSK